MELFFGGDERVTGCALSTAAASLDGGGLVQSAEGLGRKTPALGRESLPAAAFGLCPRPLACRPAPWSLDFCPHSHVNRILKTNICVCVSLSIYLSIELSAYCYILLVVWRALYKRHTRVL